VMRARSSCATAGALVQATSASSTRVRFISSPPPEDGKRLQRQDRSHSISSVQGQP
jgi:hypothetical protein